MVTASVHSGAKSAKGEEIMKSVRMKGKSVEEAKKAALEVLGAEEGKTTTKIISEGKAAIMGIIGGEEAEVEVIVKEPPEEEAKQILQNILDKMGFLAMVEAKTEEETILLAVKGEDMGRIIGKEGAMLKALETIVGSMLWKSMGERKRVSVDAGEYNKKRINALERLAEEVAKEVEKTGTEKTMPALSAFDRRAIHLFLQKNTKVTTYSTGEGKERRLVIVPRK